MLASSRLTFDKTIKCDREFAHADSGRVVDSICDSTCRARDADLTDGLDAEGIHVWIVFLDEVRFDRGTSAFTGIWYSATFRFIGDRTAGP